MISYNKSTITDHLGNVRATFRNNATGQVVLLQTTNYYPFGLRVNTSAYESTFPNEYFYQGKELDNENGLNLYNFHARLYDPVLGRWHTPDPAQQYVSPYMAMGNDPVNKIDPDGMYTGNFWEWVRSLFNKSGSRLNKERLSSLGTTQYVRGSSVESGADWAYGTYDGFLLCASNSSRTLGPTTLGTGGGGGGGGGGSRSPEYFAPSQYRGNGGNAPATSINREDIPQLRPNPYRTVVRGNGVNNTIQLPLPLNKEISKNVVQGLTYIYAYTRGSLPEDEKRKWISKPLTMEDVFDFSTATKEAGWRQQTYFPRIYSISGGGISIMLYAEKGRLCDVNYTKENILTIWQADVYRVNRKVGVIDFGENWAVWDLWKRAILEYP